MQKSNSLSASKIFTKNAHNTCLDVNKIPTRFRVFELTESAAAARYLFSQCGFDDYALRRMVVKAIVANSCLIENKLYIPTCAPRRIRLMCKVFIRAKEFKRYSSKIRRSNVRMSAISYYKRKFNVDLKMVYDTELNHLILNELNDIVQHLLKQKTMMPTAGVSK